MDPEEQFINELKRAAGDGRLGESFDAGSQVGPATLSEIFNSIFLVPLDHPISLFFIVVISVIFLCSLAVRQRMLASNNSLISIIHNNSITTLPALGVLGTFVGVLVAVESFDPGNIQGSLDRLLEGLAISFSTSVWGLGSSVILRFFPDPGHTEEVTEIGAEEVFSAIKDLQKSNDNNFSELIKAISGDGDGSLHNQMKLMRTDLNDFARELAKTNTDTLIEALKGAIQEFNENLAEQFGSNFAQLNEAVGKLLEWQENNKRDMEELRRSLDQSIGAIEKSAEGIEKIEMSIRETSQHLSGLGDLSELLQRQVADLEERLEAFAEMSQKASDAMPRIEELLRKYTEGLDETLSSIMSNISESVASSNAAGEEIAAQSKDAISSIKDVSQATQDTAVKVITNAGDLSSQAVNTIADNAVKSVGDFNNRMLNAINSQMDTFKDASNIFNESANETISNIQEAATNASASSTALISEFYEATDNLAGKLGNALTDVGEKLNSQTERFADNFAKQLAEAQASQEQAVANFSNEMKDVLKNQVDQISNSVENHKATIEGLIESALEQMRDGQEKVIETELQVFADKLGAIASRLVETYEPLTDSLRKINEVVSRLDER